MNLKLTVALGMVITLAAGSFAQNPPADDSKAKERELVLRLNEKLSQAQDARKAGDLDRSIAILQEAIAIDPSRDLLWFRLGESLRLSKRYQEAISAYTRAIEIKPVAAYYNNLGEAQSKSGNVQAAAAAYRTAAQVDPANAAQYLFNLGAIETNAGDLDAANPAYDEVIRADPNFANAYYQKGLNLLSDSETLQGSAVFPSEAATDLKKYLDLMPSGPYASMCHQVLEFMDRSITTTYVQGMSEGTGGGSQSPQSQSVAPSAEEAYMIRKIMPAYPALAREARVQGRVILHALISVDGNVFELDVRSGNPFLDVAAIDAVKQWQYKPFLVDSQPVPVQTYITVNFSLDNSGQARPPNLDLKDVLQLFQNRMPSEDVAALMQANKVSFDITEITERKIREAGGDDAVIRAAKGNHQ